MKPLSLRFKEYAQMKHGLTALWGESDKVGKWRIDDLLTVSISHLELLTTCDITTLQITVYKQLRKWPLHYNWSQDAFQLITNSCCWHTLLQLEWVKERKELKNFYCIIRQFSNDSVLGDGWNVSLMLGSLLWNFGVT